VPGAPAFSAAALAIPALTVSISIPVDIAGEYGDKRVFSGGRGVGGLGRERCAGEVVACVCEVTVDGLDLGTGCLPFVFMLLGRGVAPAGSGVEGDIEVL
jgi:hypothetical protein